MAGQGPKLPLSDQAAEGSTLKNIIEVVKQNLKILLLTSPYEKIMDIHFGVGLQSLLFEQDSLPLRDEIVSRIHKQAAKYLPYLRIEDVIFNDSLESSGDSHLLKVTVVYNITPLNTEDIIEINLD